MPSFDVTVDLDSISASTTDKLIAIIQLIYGIPSFLLMILLFFFFSCSKNYSNSFYRLVQLDLLTNIICYLNAWITLRLENHQAGVEILKSIESTTPGLLDWTSRAMIFFLHMQFCSTIALNFHRISSVLFYAHYEKFWTRFYPIYGMICLIYSTLQMLYSGKFYHLEIISNGSFTASYSTEAGTRAMNLAALFSTVYFLLLLIVIPLSVFLVSRKLKNLLFHDPGVSKKLTKIALTYCTLAAGILLWSILNALDAIILWQPEFLNANRHIILLFCSDMMTLALPYILLIYDANVRREVMGLFAKRTDNGITQVSSFVNQ